MKVSSASFYLVLFLSCTFWNSLRADTAYVDRLIEKARQNNLAEQRYWHLLLHYKTAWFGGVTSEADGAAFFNAQQGRTDPAAELEATLRSFFAPAIIDDSEQQHPQCRFIARYHWLNSQLDFDPRRLQSQPCPRYQAWIEALAPKRAVLIFASYYLNNPASIFGHTLLRFDRDRGNGRRDLLSYAVNYAADTGDDGGLAFMVLGLTGGYKGTFSNYPYYFKVQEYSNIKKRDIWEYELRFSKNEIDRMLRHLWELGGTHFNYYFFDENCSYHLLGLLEIADPTLSLQRHFFFFTPPSDTVKLIFEQPGLVTEVRYRPSVQSRLRRRFSLLNDTEKRAFRYLTSQQGSLEDELLAQVEPKRRGLVADASFDYFNVENYFGKDQDYTRRLRSERSGFPAGPELPDTEYSTPPHQGHGSARVGASFGHDTGEAFAELRLRAGYHDLLDRDEGYLPNSQIQMLQFRLRWYGESEKLHLEQATLIDVQSITPIDELARKPSWKITIGVQTLRGDSCTECNAFELEGGPGLAFSSHLIGEEVFYLFTGLFFQASPALEGDIRIGPQARAGMILDMVSSLKLQFEAIYNWEPVARTTADYWGRVALRQSLWTNSELRVEATHYRQKAEGVVSALYHF